MVICFEYSDFIVCLANLIVLRDVLYLFSLQLFDFGLLLVILVFVGFDFMLWFIRAVGRALFC